jgi:rhamnosyltransferase
LAAYKGMAWLEEQLLSILQQQNVELRIVASVDRSADQTEEWLRRRSESEPRLSMLNGEYEPKGAAQNFFRLLRESDFTGCDYVCLADQDDIWLPGKLERAVTVLQRERADAYSSNVVAFWPNGREVLIRKSQPQRRWDHLFEAPGPGCTFVMRRDLALALQRFSRTKSKELEQIALHDWLIYAFARTRGFKWTIDDRAQMRYRQHGTNVVGANHGWQAFRHRAKLGVSGWYLAQARLIAVIVGADVEPFVQRNLLGGVLGCFRLALAARSCRRRTLDQMFFAGSCLLHGCARLLTHSHDGTNA